MKFDTICVQGSYKPKSADTRVVPICQSTTYYFENTNELAHLFDVPKDGHIYTRISNPTTAEFEQKITLLEGGIGAMCCASGMAATLAAVLNVAGAGDNIISFGTIYGGTFNLFKSTLPKYGIDTRFITTDMSDKEVEALIDGKTKLLFAETIANPSMNVLDIARYAEICKKHKILFVVDNTLTTPALVKPFDFGVNVIVHSTTKYLDGHAVAVGGVVVDGGNFDFSGNLRYEDFYTPDPTYHGITYIGEGGKAAFILKARMQLMRDMGVCISPFNAWLTNLGCETLHLRMERHSSNALAAAKMLAAHKNVESVFYPGLEDDKWHKVASNYYKKGCGGMLAFNIAGGREKAAKFIEALELVKQVTHIGDARSCVLHPATTTHRQLSDADLAKAGINPGFIRLSIGIEDESDIVADIKKALDKI